MRLGGGSKAQVLVTAAWSLALALLVLLTASWNLGLAARASGPFSVFPEDPSVTYDRAFDELRASKGRALPQLLPAVDRAVDLDPLDGRPLFLHALDRILFSPSKAPPIPMLEASRRQNPRLVETRLLLLDAYGRSGRAGAAMAEAKTLMSLIPQQTPLIVRLMAGLAGRPGGPEELERALPTSEVKGEVMGRLAQTGADRALLERLARPMRGLARDPAQRQWIGQLTYTLLRRPDPDAARTLWSIFYDVSPAQVGAGVTDPEFRAGKGDPPFGWSMAPGAGGIATVRNGGLEVYYYGRSTANFASQTLMLPPGTYWLSSAVSSSDSQPASGLAWQVRCMDTTGPLLTTAPMPVFIGAAGRRAAFAVPAENCSSQVLLLAGVPPDVARNESARIERVTIERKVP